MGWSEWIALGAAIVSSVISVISWQWAKNSAQEAKRANALQLHSYRENLYVAFYDLSKRFDFEREHIDFDHVFAFQRYSKTCFLYVTPQLAEQMRVFHKRVWKVTDKQKYQIAVRKRIEDTKSDPFADDQHRSAIAESYDLWQEIQVLVEEAIPIGRTALAALGDEIRIPIPEPFSMKRKKSL